jgi:hypothetical protein
VTVPEEVRAEVAEREARMGNTLVDLGRGWQVVRTPADVLMLTVGTRYGPVMDGVSRYLSPEDAAALAAALGGGGAPTG